MSNDKPQDENKLIAERRQKLDALRERGEAFPNDFRRNAIAEELAGDTVKEVKWHESAPQGKMDLVVDLNFRMDTSALYSDIILPAATWYEKADLNSTDMHSFIHPLSPAVPPCQIRPSVWITCRAGSWPAPVSTARSVPRRIIAHPPAA